MEFLKAVEFFDLSQDLFCIIGTDGYLKKANSSFQKSVGYSIDELLANPLSHFLHEDDLASFTHYYKAYLSSATTHMLVNRFKCADGALKWFSWSGTKLADEPYIYASLRDVSAQKNLEEQLRKTLQFNQRILDSSLDLICAINTQGRFVSVSKASECLLGYTPEEMTGRLSGEFLHPADREVTSKMAQDLIDGIELTNFENRYIHKNGSVVPVTWSARWSEDDQTFYCSARNATERKKQEQGIKFNEKRFKELIQTASDVIAILDLRGNFKYLTPAVTNILGYDPEFLTDKNLHEFVHHDYQETVAKGLHSVSQQYRIELPLFKLKDAKGEWKWIKTIITNLISEDTIGGIVANLRDVTDQILAEKLKEKATRRLKNLIENYTQGYFALDKDWIVREINPATLKLLRTSEDMLLNKSIFELFPNHQSNFVQQYQLAVRENRFVEFEETMVSTNRWFQISAYPYEEGLTIFFKEITYEKQQQLLVNLEKEVLELHIRSETALKNTVDCYLTGITEVYDFKPFLSLYNKDKSLLVPFSAPGLPSGYVDLVREGVAVSLEMGSCGAAAFTKDCYIVRDISSHPNYTAHRDVLLSNNLHSCWSLPLISAGGKLLGTLGIYHGSIKVPDEFERELVKRVGSFLQILIESHQIKERLLISNERYRYVTLATNDATYDWNILSGSLYWGDGAGKLFGYTERKTKLSDWESRVHPEEREHLNNSLEVALNNPQVTSWHEEYRYKKADGTYALVIEDGYILRNEHKQPIRMVGALKDITKLKENANQILKQNKRLQEIATINSHHIRKPLANVLGIINILKSAEEDSMEELLRMLEESGAELDKIVRKIAKKTLV